MTHEEIILKLAERKYYHSFPCLVYDKKEERMGLLTESDFTEYFFTLSDFNITPGVYSPGVSLIPSGRSKKLVKAGSILAFNHGRTRIFPVQNLEITTKNFEKGEAKKLFDSIQKLEKETIQFVCL